MFEAIIFFALVIFATAVAYRSGGKASANEIKAETANEALDDVKKANDIVDHYNSDPAYRNRVRERFTRK